MRFENIFISVDDGTGKRMSEEKKNGDLEARNELIERNMRLVAHVAKKYQNPEDRWRI